MHLSTDRILTTHVGSLPRSPALTDLLIRQERDEAIDTALLAREAQAAVAAVVERQIAAGVDIINDGEQPRVGFQTYVPQRMKGFGGASSRPFPTDYRDFPDFAKAMASRFARRSKVRDAPQAIAEVRYDDLSAAEAECALFEAASAKHAGRYVERFMTAASPGIIATTMLNAWYDSHEKYVFALAREMRKEYELIVARGYVLQLDAPDLAMERVVLFQDKPLAEFLAVVELHVAALNEALANIPRDRVRLHCCWGNWEGPHVHDVPVGEILPLLYQARVGGLSLEFANPRHQHEYAELKRQKLPAGMVLLPGVLDSTTNYVEHPEVVANRICEAVAAVGDRTRVIASTDCGFGTFAGYEFVAPDVVWAKLQAAAEGARIATKRLWG
ncbi:methionine synthase [Vineibacter terrae]|uniref:Methionine synthase n=1 Tax=Vineibacter terrae TaxID=2586908 RepID=A0A5C8PUG3_9HYPH|nr:methionine synthase [Vineibacter terrae]TXL81603.1 methionine synthase [Vineibacter terrae]